MVLKNKELLKKHLQLHEWVFNDETSYKSLRVSWTNLKYELEYLKESELSKDILKTTDVTVGMLWG